MTLLVTCVVIGCEPGDADERSDADSASEPQTEVKAATSEEPKVLAVVNDRQITRKQIDERLERLDELYRHSQQHFDEPLRSERHERVLQQLIDRELLREHVQRRDIRVDDDQVDQKLQRRIHTKFGSSDSFRRYLDTHDLSADDYRREIYDQVATKKMLETEAGVEDIDEEYLREHYQRIAERRPAEQRLEASVITVHIDEDVDTSEVQQKISARIEDNNGEASLRSVYEELDTQFDMKFQDRRWYEASQLRRRAADTLFTDDAPGEGMATVHSNERLELYWIHERREAGIRGFDEVEDLLRDRARRSLLERQRRQLLERLRDEATITFYLPREAESPKPADE